MRKLEFFIVRCRSAGYLLLDEAGDLHLAETFPDRGAAADRAVRLAQAAGALYAIYGMARS